MNHCSAINPILYNALSTKFRHSFRLTLHCRRQSTVTPGYPTIPSSTYLTTTNTRLSTFSSSRLDLEDHREHNNTQYVEKNGLLGVKNLALVNNTQC